MGDLEKVSVAVMVGPKGRGSNMKALIEAGRSGVYPGEVSVVVSPSAEAPAVATAEELGVPVKIVPYGDGYGARLLEAFGSAQWLCLAGFLRVVPSEVIQKLQGRVLNIHPSLLPKHGGKGMYGIKVHQAVLDAGDQESGCTVHWVTDGYDEGAPLLQLRCPVEPGDTAETLSQRVLRLEHQAFAQALNEAIHARGA